MDGLHQTTLAGISRLCPKNMNHFYQYWFFEIVKTVNIVLNLEGILELVSKELNHLAAILHVYAGGLNFMK